MKQKKAGIYSELRTAKESITSTFSNDTIEEVKTASFAVTILILLQIAVRMNYHCTSQRQHHR